MNDNLYIRCIEIIKAVRHMDSFTQRNVEFALGYKDFTAYSTLKKLKDIGSIKEIGKKKAADKNIDVYYYEVDPMAITKLRNARGKSTEPVLKVKPEKDKEDILCGITFVEKACIEGMGCSPLHTLDYFLSGVRP